MSQTTSLQFDEVTQHCRNLFINKMKDYGPAWRILRLPSLTDQIFIKAQRIRSIENKGTQLVEDDLQGEFVGIFNYSLIALIQLQQGVVDRPDMDTERATELYDHFVKTAKELMERKNHDYGEAWREMRISSITDLILQKILRIKQIEDNSGKTIVSEGLDANYLDMVNYAAFVLIKMSEN
jgi:hypothetical protein